jgi:hypothetical protein
MPPHPSPQGKIPSSGLLTADALVRGVNSEQSVRLGQDLVAAGFVCRVAPVAGKWPFNVAGVVLSEKKTGDAYEVEVGVRRGVLVAECPCMAK